MVNLALKVNQTLKWVEYATSLPYNPKKFPGIKSSGVPGKL